MMRVICAGHVNWDVTLQVDHLPTADSEADISDRHSGGGGSAANTAVALSQLGVDAGIIASVGDDRDGRAAQAELRENGVDTTGLQVVTGQTAVKYLVVAPDGEAFVLGTDGANEAVDPNDVPASFIETADHLHLTGQNPETAAILAERARGAGLGVSFDPGRRSTNRTYEQALALADIVFVNRRETDLIEVPDGCIAVRKHGVGGASVETPDETHHHSGFSIDAVDTTGAGDAFAAGFITTLYDSPSDYHAALTIGNACGALTAREKGTRPGLSWEAIEAIQEP
ncbi:carbohydrate kinase family protein [Halocatena marina]|uniref:Carbohydrate kinase family protein n=1 Tax=Halocatena marina TaxID=2934937 RepID=A0ABD5YRM4_9EURY